MFECYSLNSYLTLKKWWRRASCTGIDLFRDFSVNKILRKELPGMRGYSVTSMKNMRKFYENWIMLDPNPSVVSGESSKSTSTLADLDSTNSPSALVELQNIQNQDVAKSAITIVELKNYKIVGELFQMNAQQRSEIPLLG